jgi:hypothetical protein
MPDCEAIVVDFSEATACTELRVVVFGVGVCLGLPNCDENLRQQRHDLTLRRAGTHCATFQRHWLQAELA